MVTINGVDQDIINQNPTPHEIKEQLASLKLANGTKPKKQTHANNDNSDQENQKPTNGTGRKSKMKKHRISLTPGFYGGRKETMEAEQEKISSILGVKDYSPFERENAERRARRKKENDEIEPTEKLFIGKLPLDLTEEELHQHFSQFGMIVEAIIKDQRGFGFITFSSIAEANAALNAPHIINSCEIEVKRAMPNRFSSNTRVPPGVSIPAAADPGAEGYCVEFAAATGVYPAYPAYPATPMFIPAFPPPILPTELVAPVEPTSPPDESSHDQTTSDKSDYVDSVLKQNDMDGDLKQQCKLFIGGLHWKTQDSDLKDYFSKMGTVTDAMVILEPNSQRSRGFGFVVFSNAEEAESVFADKDHEINGKMVDVKRAISKDDDNDSEKLAHVPVEKIFVGGIRKDTTKEFLVNYFQTTFDGKVTRVDMKTDETGQNNRGFAFITFDSTDVVDKICASKFHRIGSHFCEVKKAHPKNCNENQDGNNNGRRPDKSYEYQAKQEYRDHSFYAPMAHHNPHPAYMPYYMPQATPIPMGAYTPSANGTQGAGSDLSGDYIGGTWYPKQQVNGSDNGIDEPMAPPGAAYIPTLFYPAAPYPSAYYPPTYAPAAYFPAPGLPQKDI